MPGTRLIAVLSSQYSRAQKTVVDALDTALGEYQFELIHIAGGALQSRPSRDGFSASPSPRNAIYSMARNFDVAGYILLNDAIGNHAPLDALIRFTLEFSHKPVVSLGVVIPELPSVDVDNYTSMVELMLHMTENPDRRNFVFIRGYPDHPVSVLREKAFRDVLARRQIPIDESLILTGNFIAADAYFALDKLLSRNRNIDAIVSANNDMAHSAIDALSRHNLRVPEDVIVSGFKNSGVPENTVLAVTTMDDALKQRIHFTAKSIVDQIAHPEKTTQPSAPHYVQTRLIVRKTTNPSITAARSDASRSLLPMQKLQNEINLLTSQIDTPAQLDIGNVVEIIISMFSADNEQLEILHKQLQVMMYAHINDIHWWRYLNHAIGNSLVQSSVDSGNSVSDIKATHILVKLNSLIAGVEAARGATRDRYRDSVARLRINLSECSTLKELESTLRLSIEHFELSRGFICLYEHSGGYPAERSRLIFQHPLDTIDSDPSTLFQSAELLPNHYLSRNPGSGLLLEPLCVGSTHLGYLILDREFGRIPDIVYPTEIAMDISNALYRCF